MEIALFILRTLLVFLEFIEFIVTLPDLLLILDL